MIIESDHFELSARSVISSKQTAQGLNTLLTLKSKHLYDIEIDSIGVSTIMNDVSLESKVVSAVLSGERELTFPITLNLNQSQFIKVNVISQESLEVKELDSLVIDLKFHFKRENQPVVQDFKLYKQYNTLRYYVSL